MNVTHYKKEPWSSIFVWKEVSQDFIDYMLALDYITDFAIECTDSIKLAKIHHIRDILIKERNK